jgi:hypothetical protein
MADQKFNAKRFLTEHFQNPATLIARCRAGGVEPPSLAQAEKWFSRNSIPAEWLVKLVAVRQIDGIAINVADYMEGALS